MSEKTKRSPGENPGANSENNKDPMSWEKWMEDYTALAKKTQDVVQMLSKNYQPAQPQESAQNLAAMAKRYTEYWEQLAKNPNKIIEAQVSFAQEIMQIWQQFGLAMLGQKTESTSNAQRTDKRFKNEEWDNNPLFASIKQAYFVTSEYLQSLTTDVKGLDPKVEAQIKFYTQQFIDALSPTNFVLTNPEILKKTVETNGANLIHGFNNMLDDLKENQGRFQIKMTDMNAFEVGKNVAVTPGKVVYQNEMMQLIQYDPTTKQVGAVPLLVIPPWINKYYILDLRPDNSLVKFAIDQGHTVFMISWVNPTAHYAQKGFEDYMLVGPIAAMQVIEKITNQEKVNALAFCIGGTLLGCTAAYLAAKHQDKINSLTFLASLMDFSIPGDLGIFIDDEQVTALEAQMAKVGYLDGRDMRMVFNLLRSNDLIWSYFVNNYLGGELPFPFDLLYWNCDSTNLPAKMHSFYLRQMYGKNLLAKPNGISLDNTPLDLTQVTAPAYFISTEYDHIAPWEGTYKGAILLNGDVRFVLGGSGHIAGIVNPPAKEKYGFRTNTTLPKDAKTWYEGSEQHDGSWWLDWQKWITPFMGAKVPARIPGEGAVKALENAPGSYVQVKL